MNTNNKFLTHKVLPILSVFLLVLFTMFTSCFASVDFNVNNNTYTFPDFPFDTNTCDYVIFQTNETSNNFYVASLIDGYKVYVDSNGNIAFMGSVSGCYNIWKLKSNIWNKYSSGPTSSNGGVLLGGAYPLSSDIGVLYTTFDIFDESGKTLVFPKAPQEVVPEITKTLVEQTKQLGMSPMEQIKTILPVVLITIVSLIAFWKGLCLVRRILSQA